MQTEPGARPAPSGRGPRSGRLPRLAAGRRGRRRGRRGHRRLRDSGRVHLGGGGAARPGPGHQPGHGRGRERRDERVHRGRPLVLPDRRGRWPAHRGSSATGSSPAAGARTCGYPAAAAGLILGALAAAAVTRWTGGLDGRAAFLHQLAVAAPGTRLHQPLTLGATSGLAFWPLAAAFIIVVIEVAARWHAARHARQRRHR